MSSFDVENNALISKFLESTFIKAFSADGPGIENMRSLELQINSTCDLGCKYCYYTNFGKELYPTKISKNENVLNNLKAMLNWLLDNRLTPSIDIFTGEIFAQKVGRDTLDIIYDFYKDVPEKLRIPSITVPTNYTFILDDELTEYAEAIAAKFKSIGIYMGLSASFDGKFMDAANRPFKAVAASNGEKEDPRDDAYYDKVFAFNKKHRYGFHPMVYSNKIDQWIENFNWFQENIEKFGLSWVSIYLLEVRNAEWTKSELKSFGDFMRYLINFSWEKCDKDIDKYLDFIGRGKGFNILSSNLGRTGRGVGCSLQSMLYVRLGDLSIVPCHRTMYPGFETAKFEKVGDRIVNIKATNPELMLGTFHFEGAAQPYCEDCAIAEVCAKGCMGAQLEVMGDMFTPIPTVCELEYVKIYSMADEYRKLGILDQVLKGRRGAEEAWKSVLRLYDNQESK